MPEKKQTDGLVWKVAAGVIIGLITMGGIERCSRVVYLNAAVKELERVGKDPDPMGLRAKSAQLEAERRQYTQQVAQQRKQAAQRTEATRLHRGELKPGEACLNNELYRPKNGVLTSTGKRCNY